MGAGGVLNMNPDVKPGLKRSLKVGFKTDVNDKRSWCTFFIPGGRGDKVRGERVF